MDEGNAGSKWEALDSFLDACDKWCDVAVAFVVITCATFAWRYLQ